MNAMIIKKLFGILGTMIKGKSSCSIYNGLLTSLQPKGCSKIHSHTHTMYFRIKKLHTSIMISVKIMCYKINACEQLIVNNISI